MKQNHLFACFAIKLVIKNKKKDKMKVYFKLIAVLLIVFSASTIFAKTDPAESTTYCKVVAEQKDKMYKVVYNTPFEQDVTVEIYDDSKKVVYREKVSETTGFIKRYNLSFLSLGEYEIIVKSSDYVHEESIDLGGLSKMELQLESSGSNVSFVGSHPEGKDLNVYIYDQYNDLLYTDAIKGMKQLKKTYNLEKVAGTSVSFLIYTENTLIKKQIFDL